MQGHVVIIIDPTHVLSHDAAAQTVDILKDRGETAEIHTQLHAGLRRFFRGIGLIAPIKKLRSCLSEPVDALLHVADAENIVLLFLARQILFGYGH